MTGWQRAAWVSSWIAPVAGALTLLSIALALAAERQGSALNDIRVALQMSVLVFAAISIVTHAVLLYRVHKGSDLTPEESSKLAVSLKFGFGYSAWRRAVRRNRT